MRSGKRFESARQLSLCPWMNSILITEEVPGTRAGAWQQ
jgi:hypothetical protein